jgi:enediyne biosynthesis protein E4
VKRRDFLKQSLGAGILSSGFPLLANSLGFQFVDATAQAGIDFRHNSGAYGGKLLPETLGSGCAFLDYDADGWPDILLINSMDWPSHKRQRSTLKLFRNNRNGTFTDVTKSAGLDLELYGMGVAVADYDNDGFPDIFISCVGQSRLFHNTGKGNFIDVTQKSALLNKQAFSTSALWFDYDRDGLLDLFVCNYVRWSAEHDVFCSLDGKNKSYCTP